MKPALVNKFKALHLTAQESSHPFWSKRHQAVRLCHSRMQITVKPANQIRQLAPLRPRLEDQARITKTSPGKLVKLTLLGSVRNYDDCAGCSAFLHSRFDLSCGFCKTPIKNCIHYASAFGIRSHPKLSAASKAAARCPLLWRALQCNPPGCDSLAILDLLKGDMGSNPWGLRHRCFLWRRKQLGQILGDHLEELQDSLSCECRCGRNFGVQAVHDSLDLCVADLLALPGTSCTILSLTCSLPTMHSSRCTGPLLRDSAPLKIFDNQITSGSFVCCLTHGMDPK